MRLASGQRRADEIEETKGGILGAHVLLLVPGAFADSGLAFAIFHFGFFRANRARMHREIQKSPQCGQ